MKSKRLSRMSLVAIFVVAVIAGIALRLIFMPPAIALTGSEAGLVGVWEVTNSTEESRTIWDFKRERTVIVCAPQNASTAEKELWRASWKMSGDELKLTEIQSSLESMDDNTSFTVSFAENPSEFAMTSEGKRLDAKRTK